MNEFPQETWELLHFAGADDVPDTTDLSNEMIPTHPVEGIYACWAVNHPTAKLTDDFPTPTMTVGNRGWSQTVWFIRVPVRPGQKGYDTAVNKWKQVIAALTHELEGEEAVEVLNPTVVAHDKMIWYGKTLMMKNFVDHLKKHKKFGHNIHPDFLEAGGMSKTALQTATRKANFAKAREAAKETHRKRGIKTAEKIMALVAEGLTNEQIAEHMNVAVASVPTTVARARKTLGLEEAQVSVSKKSEPLTSLDEMVALAEASLSGID